MEQDVLASMVGGRAVPPPGFDPGREERHGEREPGLMTAVLRAVATMARLSKRQQAELGVALQRAGLDLDPPRQQAVLLHLCDIAAIEDVIPLADGGILLSVTAAGMERGLR